MDVREAGGGDRVVRRIAALLVACALLAERAAVRSWPVRLLVLWVLRRAEAVVADYLFDVTGTPAPDTGGMAALGNSPDDAMLLGMRLRALATALGVLLCPDKPSSRASSSISGALRRRALCLEPFAVRLGGWAPRPIDTS